MLSERDDDDGMWMDTKTLLISISTKFCWIFLLKLTQKRGGDGRVKWFVVSMNCLKA